MQMRTLLFLLAACAHIEPPISYTPGKYFHYSNLDYLNYQVQGHGPVTLVLLHGFGSSLHNWDDICDQFDPNLYTVYSLDLKEFGFSSVPSNNSYSIKANAELVTSFICAHQLSNFWLIGHSLGGGVSLYTHLMSQSSDHTPPNGMILISSAAYPTKLPFFITYLRYTLVNRTAFAATSPEFKARYSLERMYNNPEIITDTLLWRYAAFMSNQKFPAFAGTARDIVPGNIDELTQSYSDIMCPVLVIWGDNDQILPLSSGRRLAAELQEND